MRYGETVYNYALGRNTKHHVPVCNMASSLLYFTLIGEKAKPNFLISDFIDLKTNMIPNSLPLRHHVD